MRFLSDRCTAQTCSQSDVVFSPGNLCRETTRANISVPRMTRRVTGHVSVPRMTRRVAGLIVTHCLLLRLVRGYHTVTIGCFDAFSKKLWHRRQHVLCRSTLLQLPGFHTVSARLPIMSTLYSSSRLISLSFSLVYRLRRSSILPEGQRHEKLCSKLHTT